MEEQEHIPSYVKQLQERFSSALSLPEEKIRAINTWIKSNLDMFYERTFNTSEIAPVADELEVSVRQFHNTISIVGTLLFGGDLSEALSAVLKETDIHEPISKIKILLDGIDWSPNTRNYIRQKNSALHNVIPTLEAVHAVSDLRAIFGTMPGHGRLESRSREPTNLIQFEPVAIVSLNLNDPVSNDTVCSFQLTERGLRELVQTLQEALVQFEIVKREGQKIIPPAEVSS